MAEIRRVLRPGGIFCFAEPRASYFRSLVDAITLSPLARLSKTLRYRRIILLEEMEDYQQWLAGQDGLFGLLESSGFRPAAKPRGLFRLFAKWEAV